MTEQKIFLDYAVDFLADRQATGKANSTYRYYKQELFQFIEWLELTNRQNQVITDFTPAQLREYFTYITQPRPSKVSRIKISKGRGKSGRHGSFRAIRAIFNWIWIQDDIDQPNPIIKVKVEPSRRPPLAEMPTENIRAMLSQSNHRRYELRDKSIIYLLYDTGLRASELCDLNYGDVNLNTGQINILHGKGDKFRINWLGTSTIRILREYLETRKDIKPDEPLFLNQEGRRLTYSALRVLLTRLCSLAEIPYQGVHSLRRAMAKTLWKKGVDILAISHLLGHSNLNVTTRYLNINNEEYHEIHSANSPADLLN